VWDYQEFAQWLSEVYHGTAAGDPFRAGTTLARLRRLFTSPAAAAAFASSTWGRPSSPEAPAAVQYGGRGWPSPMPRSPVSRAAAGR
jgi:hypothetical protein